MILSTGAKRNHPVKGWFLFGAPEWIRTIDTQRRRLVLYPTELRVLVVLLYYLMPDFAKVFRN